MDSVSNATDAMNQFGATTTYETPFSDSKRDRNKFGAEVQNDWAMALFNAAQEQAQWQRNVDYNDPINEYARLIAAGMNPLLAMRSVAGEGSQASSVGLPQGSASARAASGSEQASVGKLGNALSAAGNISNAAQQFAEARLASAEADEFPATARTVQDLNRAQSFLARQNAKYVPRIAESSANASDARAKYDAAAAGQQKAMQQLTETQRRIQLRELAWYDKSKLSALGKQYQETLSLIQGIKESISKTALNKSGIGLNRALAGLYHDQAFLVQTQQLSQKLDNMFRQTGIPPSMAGAALLQGMSQRGLFSQLGQWKYKVPFDSTNQLYSDYNTLRSMNFDGMIQSLKVDQKQNAQWWINNILSGVNAASGVAGAVSGLKGAFNPAVHRVQQLDPPGTIRFLDGTMNRPTIGSLLNR